jgi:hypothetical protein
MPPPAPAAPPPGRSRLASPLVRLGLAIGLVAIIGGGLGIWYLFLRPSGPPPVDLANLPIATAGASARATATAATSPAPTDEVAGATATPAGTAAAPAGLDGTWSVDPSLGTGDPGTFVGYRVRRSSPASGQHRRRPHVGRQRHVHPGRHDRQRGVVHGGSHGPHL